MPRLQVCVQVRIALLIWSFPQQILIIHVQFVCNNEGVALGWVNGRPFGASLQTAKLLPTINIYVSYCIASDSSPKPFKTAEGDSPIVAVNRENRDSTL